MTKNRLTRRCPYLCGLERDPVQRHSDGNQAWRIGNGNQTGLRRALQQIYSGWVGARAAKILTEAKS